HERIRLGKPRGPGSPGIDAWLVPPRPAGLSSDSNMVRPALISCCPSQKRRRGSMKSRFYVFGFAALLAVGAAGDPPYEAPPQLKASDFLDAKLLQGPDYVVEPVVTSDGVFNTYTITSNFGTWKVQSTSMAAIRVHEVSAIAQLKNVDKIAVAAG